MLKPAQIETELEFEREENRQWREAARKVGCLSPGELVATVERVFKI